MIYYDEWDLSIGLLDYVLTSPEILHHPFSADYKN